MFTLTGRTFVAYEDKHLGLSTVALLTQSQGNTNEDEWFALLVNLIESDSMIYIASFRGMAVNTIELNNKVFKKPKQGQNLQQQIKRIVLKQLKIYELNISKRGYCLHSAIMT